MPADDFPLCRERGALFDTINGPRVSLSALFMRLSPSDRGAWYRQAASPPADGLGIFPAAVERFLTELQRDNLAANPAAQPTEDMR